jgi:3-hydroxyanthranilate 3,4-dioxygenase
VSPRLPERTPSTQPPERQIASFNLFAWIEANRERLKPPTAAYTVLRDRDYMITIVGGPNARTDYHVNPREEFYFQLEGTLTLRIQHDGKPHDVMVPAGSIYLLPRGVPHAPQRPAASVGLILEAIRQPHELDVHEWYCQQCNHKLFAKEAYLEVLERDMPPVFDAYYRNAENQICKACGYINPGRPA